MILLRDTRLGGLERWIWGEPQDLMRIADDLLQCVVFLCAQPRGGGLRYLGTGFFVHVPVEHAPPEEYVLVGYPYLVTARHCIKEAQKLGSDVLVRMNKSGGGVGLVPIPVTKWQCPDDDSVDIATTLFEPPLGFAYISIPAGMIATEREVYKYNIGPGDDLLITGLFTEHKGEQQNLPVVRMGTIAAMPTEPVIDPDTGASHKAYIAEIRSIGGLSGSPVYVLVHGRDARNLRPPPGESSIYPIRQSFLLGLIRGRWKYEGAVTIPRPFIDNDELKRLNMGLTTVEPAEGIQALFGKGEVVRKRKQHAKESQRQRGVSIEDLSATADDDEFDRFEDLTRKLVKVPKKEIDEKRKESGSE